jgi:hypothetical protein
MALEDVKKMYENVLVITLEKYVLSRFKPALSTLLINTIIQKCMFKWKCEIFIFQELTFNNKINIFKLKVFKT